MPLSTPTRPWRSRLEGAVELPDVDALDRTFVDMVRSIRPDVLTDIGSRDGEMAIRCRDVLPDASRVYAFEANPENYFEFEGLAARAGVAFVPLAIGAETGAVDLRVPTWASTRRGACRQFRGIGSTRARLGEAEHVEYTVPLVPLADFFCLPEHRDRSYAHWIDVEGCAHEVLRGLGDVLVERTRFFKIEVETRAFWEGQKLWNDCFDLCADLGFSPCAWFDHDEQFDVVFLNDAA